MRGGGTFGVPIVEGDGVDLDEDFILAGGGHGGF